MELKIDTMDFTRKQSTKTHNHARGTYTLKVLAKKRKWGKYQAQLGLKSSLIYRKIIDRESWLKNLIVQVKHWLMTRCVDHVLPVLNWALNFYLADTLKPIYSQKLWLQEPWWLLKLMAFQSIIHYRYLPYFTPLMTQRLKLLGVYYITKLLVKISFF